MKPALPESGFFLHQFQRIASPRNSE